MSDSDEKSEDNGTKVPYNLKNLVDSDSEVEEGRYNDEIEVTKKSRRILSSSEESENEQTETVKVHRRKNKNPKKKNLDEKKTRKSAVKAMQVIQEKIKDKTNLDRKEGSRNDDNDSHEKEIRIPYHKPRQFTFKEFMARRTINKPTDKKETDKSTMKSIREVQKNIEAFAQKMKEREEEALEFFRSESEEEEDMPPEIKNDEIKSNVEETSKVPEITEPTVELVESIAEVQKPIEENLEEESKPVEEKKPDRLQILKEKYGISLDIKPKLNLDPGSIIDLETGQVKPKQLSGSEKLFKTFLGTQPKLKQIKLTDMKSRLQNEIDHHRPGKGREILMESLIEKVKREKIEEMKKKTEAFKEIHNVEYELDEKPVEVEDEDENDEECEEEEEEPEENDIILKDKKQIGRDFFDGEAEDDEDNENDEESDEDESSSSEEETITSNEPRKSRIIKAFDDSDDEQVQINSGSEAIFDTEDLQDAQNEIIPSSENIEESQTDFLSTQSSFKMPSVSEDMQIPDLNEPKVTQTIEDDDLIDICSGQFAPTQIEAPVKMTQNEEFDDFVTQVDETPDLAFSTEPVETTEEVNEIPILKSRKILDSSDEEHLEETIENRAKKLKKKKKKKLLKRLGFSDSEDETNDGVIEEDEHDEQYCEEEEEEVCIDYDSEENEIEVKLTKKEKVKKATNFLENEADLSGSDWGSADEDERGLDKYDIEVGDEEDFDQAKLREEIGAIHARKILDEDIKKVKKIQDILLDDEENDGAKRERKFRWKNQTDCFDITNENAMDPDEAGNNSEDDIESETAWRKMRHEREKFLKEISESQSNTASDTRNRKILVFDQNSQTVTETEQSLICKKKLKIIRSSEIIPKSSDKFSSPSFLIKTVDIKRYSSSSFLSRDEETLNRIAKLVSKEDDDLTTSSTGNSMSFVMLDKPDEGKKRKSDGKQTPENIKKRKLDKIPSRPFLLDQLK